jgi:K+-sensing histidine kinase KdpD
MAITTKGALLDFSMPRLNEEDLAERQLREELLSALNHDLRSPLGAIGIFCEILLLNAAELDDSQRQSLSMIQEANAKAQRILDDAAELSSIYKGTVTLRQVPVSLRQLVEEAGSRHTEAFRQKDIQFSVQAAADNQVVVDPEKAEQVLLRILEEAAAYCARQGTITIAIGEKNGKTDLLVEAECPAQPPDTAIKRPSAASVKGRLGVRKANESRYSLTACEKIIALMGGAFSWQTSPQFSARLRFTTSSR